jgi:hypothetical protein
MILESKKWQGRRQPTFLGHNFAGVAAFLAKETQWVTNTTSKEMQHKILKVFEQS